MTFRTPFAALALAMVATGALADGITTADSASGPILVDEHGMSLYIFDKDTAGVSTCYDGCAANWPPVLETDGDEMGEGDFALVERTDGAMQWTYKGMPLYTWINDAAAGDITGDGVNGVWHLAKP